MSRNWMKRMVVQGGMLGVLCVVSGSCGDSHGGSTDGAVDAEIRVDAARPDSAVDAGPWCGDGILNGNETCDVAIPEGEEGACPTDCENEVPCRLGYLAGSGCGVECLTTPITVCAPDDGCCLAECNANDDSDCSPSCGNGVLEEGETCDPPESCPSECGDGDSCTQDSMLGSAATCDASCEHSPIQTCASDDGCCPQGCDAVTDRDCSPVCGNGVLEPTEECEDGSTMAGDGCDAECLIEADRTVFRIGELWLRDPHVYVQIPFLGCWDLTDVGAAGQPSVNQMSANALSTDSDGDGFVDVSALLVFRPLSQVVSYSGPLQVIMGECLDPLSSATCDLDLTQPPVDTSYTNGSGAFCLAPISQTTGGYSPGIALSSPPCFATASAGITMVLFGMQIPMQDGRVSGTYPGDPAQTLEEGMMLGFLSESDADGILIDANIPLVGGTPLSGVLPGGTGCCATRDDRDLGPDGATIGWWFYLNFRATRVAYRSQ